MKSGLPASAKHSAKETVFTGRSRMDDGAARGETRWGLFRLRGGMQRACLVSALSPVLIELGYPCDEFSTVVYTSFSTAALKEVT
jgi:hypothetical protein